MFYVSLRSVKENKGERGMMMNYYAIFINILCIVFVCLSTWPHTVERCLHWKHINSNVHTLCILISLDNFWSKSNTILLPFHLYLCPCNIQIYGHFHEFVINNLSCRNFFHLLFNLNCRRHRISARSGIDWLTDWPCIACCFCL